MKSEAKHIVIDQDRVQSLTEKAEKYSKKVSSIVTKCDYTKHESALAIALDSKYQEDITKNIAHLFGAKHVVLIGIGGSSLGVEALYSALAFNTQPILHVLDAIEEDALKKIRVLRDSLQSVEEVSVVVVSKSGTTTETLTNAVAALEVFEETFSTEIYGRTVFVGTEDSEFIQIGKKKKVTCCTFPPSIGGRFSIFTAVGTVPLAILGINLTTLHEGVGEALTLENRKKSIERTVELALVAEKSVHTVNFFTFNERLTTLGFWYRQLLAESIGKNMTTEGTTFSNQLLPMVTTSIDLHSMAQLYLGGYKGVYTHFVYADTQSEFHKLTDHWLLNHMSFLKGKTPLQIKNAIRSGVLKAYDDQKLMYRMTSFEKVSALELGQLMATMMFETMLLADLCNIDAFDQPAVESYKAHTRTLLSK